MSWLGQTGKADLAIAGTATEERKEVFGFHLHENKISLLIRKSDLEKYKHDLDFLQVLILGNKEGGTIQ